MTDAFVRLYYVALQNEETGIYEDDAAIAAYARLLAHADAVWPLTPELPRATKPRPLARLVGAGLVILLGDYRYRVKGYDAEREARQASARAAADARWHPPADAGAYAGAMPTPVPSPAPAKNDATPPPPSPARGSRDNGTSPRATGEAPRSLGTSPRLIGSSPRQDRDALKHGPTRLADILDRVRGEDGGA